jgi:hypothetical protein
VRFLGAQVKWRDHSISVDPNDMVERSFAEPAKKPADQKALDDPAAARK